MYDYLPTNANTLSEVKRYYYIRSLEMDVVISNITEDENGVFVATMLDGDDIYYSVYIPERLRGRGLLKEYTHLRILTIQDCGVTDALEYLGFEYRVMTGWFDMFEYEALKNYLGNARTSDGIYLMQDAIEKTRQHIDRNKNLLSYETIERDIWNFFKSYAVYYLNSK